MGKKLYDYSSFTLSRPYVVDSSTLAILGHCECGDDFSAVSTNEHGLLKVIHKKFRIHLNDEKTVIKDHPSLMQRRKTNGTPALLSEAASSGSGGSRAGVCVPDPPQRRLFLQRGRQAGHEGYGLRP